MAVLMTGKVPGMTSEVYDGIASNAIPRLKQSKGFISHAAGMGDDGVWTVVEVWESEEDSQRSFEENVKPNLPAGVVPDRRFRKLHNFATKQVLWAGRVCGATGSQRACVQLE